MLGASTASLTQPVMAEVLSQYLWTVVKAVPDHLGGQILAQDDLDAAAASELDTIAVVAGLNDDPAVWSDIRVRAAFRSPNCAREGTASDLWPPLRADDSVRFEDRPVLPTQSGEWYNCDRCGSIQLGFALLVCGVSACELDDDSVDPVNFWCESDLAVPVIPSRGQASRQGGGVLEQIPDFLSAARGRHGTTQSALDQRRNVRLINGE